MEMGASEGAAAGERCSYKSFKTADASRCVPAGGSRKPRWYPRVAGGFLGLWLRHQSAFFSATTGTASSSSFFCTGVRRQGRH